MKLRTPFYAWLPVGALVWACSNESTISPEPDASSDASTATDVVVDASLPPITFTYAAPDSLVLGRPITAIQAPAGVPKGATSFETDPPLPDGLIIDPASGAISGTPTSAWGAGVVTYNVLAKAAATRIRGLIALQVVTPPHVVYVDSASGNDSADGASPTTAWQTISHLNAQAVPAGTLVLLRAGSVFRGALGLQNGNSQAWTVIDAYEYDGVNVYPLRALPKPAILGSVSLDSSAWYSTTQTPGIWFTYKQFAEGVGNIWLGGLGSPTAGVRRWQMSDLNKACSDWMFNASNQVVIRSYSNPGDAGQCGPIEVALACPTNNCSVLYGWNAAYVAIQHVGVFFGGSSGFNGGGNDLSFRDLDIAYMGGVFFGTTTAVDGGVTYIRAGNGIQFWTTTQNAYVERNRLWQIYDTPLTNQSNAAVHKNIYYRNNVMWNMSYACLEIWNHGGTGSTIDNVHFENNTCVHPASNWATTPVFQRGDVVGADYFLGGITSQAGSKTTLGTVYLRNNVFYQQAGVDSGNECTGVFKTADWAGHVVMDGNDYFGGGSCATGCTLGTGGSGTCGYEAHGTTADPMFIELAKDNFTLAPGSPLIGAGVDAGVLSDFAGVRRPLLGPFTMGAYYASK